MLERILPVKITLTRPSVEILASIITSKPLQGRFIKDEIADLNRTQTKRIEQALRIGVVEGWTNSQMVQHIRGTKAFNYKDGILRRGRADIERLVRLLPML